MKRTRASEEKRVAVLAIATALLVTGCTTATLETVQRVNEPIEAVSLEIGLLQASGGRAEGTWKLEFRIRKNIPQKRNSNPTSGTTARVSSGTGSLAYQTILGIDADMVLVYDNLSGADVTDGGLNNRFEFVTPSSPAISPSLDPAASTPA